MKAVIWTSPDCSASEQAKILLELNSIEYEEKNAREEHWPYRETLECHNTLDVECNHCHLDSIPEIFIDDEHIGNYTALKEFLLGYDFSKGIAPANEGTGITINEEGLENESNNLE
jgi:glutaredoxin